MAVPRCSSRLMHGMCALVMLMTSAYSAEPSAEQLQFFETKVRPLLAERCHKCHTGDAPKGGLRLDSLSAILEGGDSGPALAPEKPEESLLIQAVNYASLEMPPSGKLSADEISILTVWVAQGAPWPPENVTRPAAAAGEFEITAEDRAHWSFQPVRRPEVPVVSDAEWNAHPIDAFVFERLAAAGLRPNSPASRRQLIRRAFFDLIGLPPTPEEMSTWLGDESADWYERLLNDLLARPQYGERWARHWLDVVRYAQTNGYERDDEKPYAWRYRDWVIRSLNDDMPYDQFVRQQLAGDELDEATPQSTIATGFYRLGVWDDEPDDAHQAEYDALDDVVSTAGAAFLGLSLGCARCHDHKFDPLPQEDYYRLLACFRNVRPYAIPAEKLDSPVLAPLAAQGAVEAWKSQQDAQVSAVEAQLAALSDAGAMSQAERDAQKAALESKLKELKDAAPPFEWALAVRERSAELPETRVLVRGNAGQPGKPVTAGVPRIFTGEPAGLPPHPGVSATTGYRRAVAEWLASPAHPLTARVMVNRVWQHHFGRGIVPTPNDFGRAGQPPTHPELLDWLAGRFIDEGWSIKRLHKLMMSSRTYCLSSSTDNAEAMAADPGNDFIWRQQLRRLEAESLRDAVLAVSGSLNPAMGGRGIFPRLSREVVAGASRPGLGWDVSTPEEESRRSIYIFVKRTMLAPILEGFDYTNTAQPIDVRPVTTVAPQALTLLNSRFMTEQAAAFADRLTAECESDTDAIVRRGYELTVARPPSDRELAVSRAFLARQRQQFAEHPLPLTIRPEAPSALSTVYLAKLRAEDLLSGPTRDWSYLKGVWQDLGEGIHSVDVGRGPYALWQGPSAGDVRIELRLRLHNNSELGAVIWRGEDRDGILYGYELRFEPVRGRVGLFRLGDEVARLAEIPDALPAGRWRSVRIESAGARQRVWLDDAADPAIDVSDAAPSSPPGRFGLRTWGSPLSIAEAYLTSDGQCTRVDAAAALPGALDAPQIDAAQRQALESFCLLLLNLNEFSYVD